ncbi:MAG: efflux RND transporter periplasmic adaptor subunit [Gammaproteobacteria bacterium]|nr:efflux RND transporter periplasmic adaptor subunit [Gammaproteobacteria bacterium]
MNRENMKLLLKIFLPLLVVGIALWGSRLLLANKPEPKRKTARPSTLAVEATQLRLSDYRVILKSYGTVRPRTETALLPEVSGRIVEVSPKFRDGGFFEAGELLLRIEPRDYEIAIAIAKAQQAQARQQLDEEKARAKVAEHDWRQRQKDARLVKRKQDAASVHLALRKPQQASARAAAESAKAQLERARLNLERTRITAPYAGRILERQADLGQYVAPGTVLARFYAIDYVEIRLPLTNRQLGFVKLPEWRRDAAAELIKPLAVTISADIGQRIYHWQGRIVHTEGAVDVKSRQLFVVAQVDDPYAKGAEGLKRPPLRIGQFVEAKIAGQWLRDVFVIPRSALRQDREVLLVDEQGHLQRRTVEIAWRDAGQAVIVAGLNEGEILVLTILGGAVSEGAFVAATIDGQAADGKRQRAKPEL